MGDIYVQVNPQYIDLLTKFIEAYEHLGIVSTLDQNLGKVIIRGTIDTRSELIEILNNMPFEILFL